MFWGGVRHRTMMTLDDRQTTLPALHTITNSDLSRPCFALHPYGKLGLFKTELVIVNHFFFVENLCTDGYTCIQGAYFYLTDSVMNFNDAINYCQSHSLGSSLASIDSLAQWNVLVTYLQER